MSAESVELAEAIQAVREQLIAAQAAGRRSGAADELTFGVGTVSIEFTGQVTKTAGASGGVKFWVVNAEAKGEHATSASQKVTVQLTPVSPDGTDFRVNDGLDAPPPR